MRLSSRNRAFQNLTTRNLATRNLPLKRQGGFSTLQTTTAILLSGVLGGTAAHYLPDMVDHADREVTRYASSAEATHQIVWETYEKAQGANAEPQNRPEPVRVGFTAIDDLVASPLGTYCFNADNPADSLHDCTVATAE